MDKVKNILDKYGIDHQKVKMIEELNELAAAANNASAILFKILLGEETNVSEFAMIRDLEKEIADILVLKDQLALGGFLNIERISSDYDYKMNRQIERIDTEELSEV